ncbi:succinate dehydrogenase cytochrome b560 subunit, mitochondrial-like isoform X1 [Coccinella septempunctata]|uniref:succinate dehydrogenase cytochrome b560 subunit, mitochondrial-like isoform X1 n=1 Tax=Coccinella septempunctata TaxID=41139 RepID=UPI001D075188|nr:succinate dehydrogenase cytochrome b560 subunit, mitochondrial-like isoform X1 [Coccinella septempunctata]XP_044757565.1 succinate dehydrogenase cytochrome b560 subunit, mitochondrial-like isoform X1 [Coccinella septempunctata]
MSILRLLQFRTNLPLVQTSTVLKILQHRVGIKPRIKSDEPLPQTDNYYDEKNMGIGRPMSPYISIYETQLQGVMSIHNRISGAIWTFQIFTFAVATLVLPESVDYYVDKINSWNIDPVVIILAKCLIAWPMVYHTVDGTRHLLWDFGMRLTNRSVAVTGWIVCILSIAGTLYLSTMV